MRISRPFTWVSAAIAALTIALSAMPGAAGKPSDVIPGQYIVMFTTDAPGAAQAVATAHGLSVTHQYRSVFNGMSVVVPEGRLKALQDDPLVAYVTEDRAVQAYDKPGSTAVTQPVQTVPTGIRRIGADASVSNGAGVTVAVIDTGIDLSHPDLSANIVADKSCITGKRTGNDDNGHGTHVAGTIAARNNGIGVLGVAPSAKLVAVKVLNSQGSGSWSSIICGMDWVTANAATLGIKAANMSLGGTGSSDGNCGLTNNDPLHRAVCRMRDAGVTVVVAAGNSAANASTSVPAAYDDAVITVSALADSDGVSGGAGAATGYGADDTFASFSNYGSAVDLGAPGVNILSTWKGSGYATISGTSMATPHVTGSAALYLASHPAASWTDVRAALQSSAEPLGAGHSDPGGLHPEGLLRASGL
jgi:subtilisin